MSSRPVPPNVHISFAKSKLNFQENLQWCHQKTQRNMRGTRRSTRPTPPRTPPSDWKTSSCRHLQLKKEEERNEEGKKERREDIKEGESEKGKGNKGGRKDIRVKEGN